ncbi:hypothetical protein ACLKMH_21730 [Psychromonas sp. KJ10-10]|uniref:hypothetical protein n=1 Tax=Psychromonas sp. KJ10-10 TaxID=3391823 RepID=UPI0039B6CF16
MTSLSALAESTEQFDWLPFLTANMNIKRLQLDKTCPQNEIVDLQVDKKKVQIKGKIAEVNWDFSCVHSESPNTQTDTQAKTQTNTTLQQIPQLLSQLIALPDLIFDVQKINLTSDIFKVVLASQLSIKKSDSQFSVIFNNEAFQGNIRLNLLTKQLTAEANIHLDKLPQYIHLDAQQAHFLNHDLLLTYDSDLNQWQTGQFTASWQGDIGDFSKQADLIVAGRVDILKQQTNTIETCR